MAAFPSFPIASLDVQADDGSRMSRGSDGTVHIARLFTDTQYTLTVELETLSIASLQTLKQFYVDNRTADDIAFTDPLSGDQYTVAMAGPPRHAPTTYGVYRATVVFHGVAS